MYYQQRALLSSDPGLLAGRSEGEEGSSDMNRRGIGAVAVGVLPPERSTSGLHRQLDTPIRVWLGTPG